MYVYERMYRSDCILHRLHGKICLLHVERLSVQLLSLLLVPEARITGETKNGKPVADAHFLLLKDP